MTAFFQNIWTWLSANSGKIVAFLTSANFVAMLTIVVNTIRAIKVNKGVTVASSDLKTELSESAKSRKIINSILSVSDSAKTVADKTKESIEEFKKTVDDELLVITGKVNAMLEVQSLVYSTIRDDSLRQTVSNLLNTARYNDANTKEQLQAEIDSLRESMNAKMNEVNQAMSNAIDKVQHVVRQDDPNSTNKLTRY